MFEKCSLCKFSGNFDGNLTLIDEWFKVKLILEILIFYKNVRVCN